MIIVLPRGAFAKAKFVKQKFRHVPEHLVFKLGMVDFDLKWGDFWA